MRDRETVRVREREIESRREDGKEEKADIRFFTSFYFPSFLQLSFPFISYFVFSTFTISLICTPLFLLSLFLPCFSLLPSSLWVLWVGVGEKVRGIFPQLGRTRPNPTPTHFLSLPPLPLSHVRGESWGKPPIFHHQVFWMFVGTLCRSLFHRHQLCAAMATE